jgi:hypothetical protein
VLRVPRTRLEQSRVCGIGPRHWSFSANLTAGAQLALTGATCPTGSLITRCEAGLSPLATTDNQGETTMSTNDSSSTNDNSIAGLHTHAATPHAPARRRAKSSRLRSAAVALAVVLGTSGGTVAVAQAATTASSHSSATAGWRPNHRTPPAAFGTVESVGTNTFTLKGPKGTTVTVDVSSSTTYRDGKDTAPSFANVTVGQMVSVEGTTASSVVTATSVSIGFGGHVGR